jgi:hypothetical protein
MIATFDRRRSQDKPRKPGRSLLKRMQNQLLGIRNCRPMVDRREDWKRKLGEARAVTSY